MFDQLDHTLKSQNRVSSFGFAAYQINKLEQRVSEMKDDLESIKGVGPLWQTQSGSISKKALLAK